MDRVTVLGGIMHSEKIHPIGAMEIEMRDGMIAFEFRENRLPVGEQLRSIARFQGFAEGGIACEHSQQGRQGLGLFIQ